MKILLFDIETSLNLGYTWGKYEQNVNTFEREWFILCFGYKWLNEKTKVVSLPMFSRYKSNRFDDKEVVKKLWEVLDEADIVIGHNLDKFDVRKTNTRFLKFNLGPPSSYQTIDTLKVIRKYFYLNSNKLNDAGEFLGHGGKHSTDFQLWLDCMNGNKKAWKKMENYCKRDVDLLEKLYLTVREWQNNHPNVALIQSKQGCPTCGSSDIVKNGFSYTRVSKRQRWKCKKCRSGFVSRLSEKDKVEYK